MQGRQGPLQQAGMQPTRLGFPIVKSETLRILLMGFFLAALLYVFFFHDSGRRYRDVTENPAYVPPRIEVPDLDAEILGQIQDETREERLVLEHEPLKHLLKKSLNVTTATAKALGMPDEEVPIPRLRSARDRYRGDYLWYEGTLQELSPPKAGHPVPEFKIYEARLVTAQDEPVMFAFSLPPDPQIRPGDWVRAEGFFMKLRDTSFPARIDEAPMLVGPYLRADYEDWAPVTELDPGVFGKLRDGAFLNGSFTETADSERRLWDDQAEPLWHLASYAATQRSKRTKADWREIPPLSSKERWMAIKHGEIARGTPMRILGTLQRADSYEAKVNPIGVEFWTSVLVQVHDLGGKLIPIWMPGQLPDGIPYGTGLEVRGYYYKRLTYEGRKGDKVITAVFVADAIDRYATETHPMARQLGWGFGGLVAFVVLLFFFMARRDRKVSAKHEDMLIERRRRRRNQGEGTAVQSTS